MHSLTNSHTLYFSYSLSAPNPQHTPCNLSWQTSCLPPAVSSHTHGFPTYLVTNSSYFFLLHTLTHPCSQQPLDFLPHTLPATTHSLPAHSLTKSIPLATSRQPLPDCKGRPLCYPSIIFT
ncbi:hypothetical protein M758_UG317200 [Ceratodon purpureus]|nr:hypothetical protein M758_UG317200 [Ceratodon purpureus]